MAGRGSQVETAILVVCVADNEGRSVALYLFLGTLLEKYYAVIFRYIFEIYFLYYLLYRR